MAGLPAFGEDVWDRLRDRKEPLYLYGTGDGADKILSVAAAKGITVDGIFVSDDFYRGQTFHDMEVKPLSELTASDRRCVAAVAFGSHLPHMINMIRRIEERHELVLPDVPIAGGEIFDLAFYNSHLEELESAKKLLADEQSAAVFDDVIEYKLTGRLHPLMRCVTPREEVFDRIIHLTQAESYVDCGAYRGDTIEEFLGRLPAPEGYKSITAFEPDLRSFRKLSEKYGSYPRITLYNAGVSDLPRTVGVQDDRGRGTSLIHDSTMKAITGKEKRKSRNTKTQLYRLDDLSLTPTMIKMDVEGYEKKAVTGAERTIREYRPKLEIACYHRSEDIFTLPLLINRINPEYRIYLRRHECFPCWELNLYVV